MGDTNITCMLGDYQRERFEASVGMRRRQYFWSEFQPTEKCLDLMNQAAAGIEGIAHVVTTFDQRTPFALVFDDDATDIAGIITLWSAAFERKLLASGAGIENLIGGLRPLDVSNVMASHGSSSQGLISRLN
jgi:hypothetical protein